MRMKARRVGCFVAVWLVWGALAAALCSGAVQELTSKDESSKTWSEFRGPGGNGYAAGGAYPVDWTDAKVQWKIALPGRGWSSPVFCGEQIWLTTAVEVSGRGIVLRAVAIDRQQGQLIHDIELFQVAEPPVLHPQNSYASPTPVVSGEVVVCTFGTMGTAAIDARTGQVMWRNTDFEFDHETGPGSSPMVWRDLVLLHCDGTDQQFVAALQIKDGKVAWIRKRSGELHPEGMMKKAFATPIVVDLAGQETLISPGANWLYGYNPATGEELWRINYDRLGFSNVPRPLFINGDVIVCTGFNKPAVQRIEVQRSEAGWQAKRKWEYDLQVPTIPSPITVQDRLVMVGDRGIATCLDLETGKAVWQKRLSGDYAASPIYAGGNLYFCNRTGKVTVVKPGDEFAEVATAELDGPIHATPAASEGQFFVRTLDSLYCIGTRMGDGTPQ